MEWPRILAPYGVRSYGVRNLGCAVCSDMSLHSRYDGVGGKMRDLGFVIPAHKE